MQRFRRKTLKAALRNGNENWMAAHLETTSHRWVRQQIAGHRIYDFFCRELGVAIEVDGEDHEPDYDHWRDLDDWRYARVLVLHVENRNEADAYRAMEEIAVTGTWANRLEAIPPEPRPLQPTRSLRPRRKTRGARRPLPRRRRTS